MTRARAWGFARSLRAALGPAPSGLPFEGSPQIHARYCGSGVELTGSVPAVSASWLHVCSSCVQVPGNYIAG